MMTETQSAALHERVLQEVCDILRWQFRPLKSRMQAEDIAQEVMLRIWSAQQRPGCCTYDDSLRLVSRKIRETLIDLHRKCFGRKTCRPRPQILSGLTLDEFPSENAAAADHKTCETQRLAAWREFHEQVEQLPEKPRAAFRLVFYRNLTHEEAAEKLHVHVRTVKRWYRQARERLRRSLWDWLAF